MTTPLDPAAPGGPPSPTDPASPAGSVGPAGPTGPTGLASTASPASPTAPARPADPARLTTPVGSAPLGDRARPATWTASGSQPQEQPAPSRILFGSAYYDEYTPASAGPDRLQRDIEMMREAGFTTIRIAESTWGTMEPAPGTYDFTHVDRVLDAVEAAGIDVIVGTPTYAVPTWMAARHPEVIAVTPAGPGRYGPRQNMNIVSPAYRYHAERAVRALVSHVVDRPSVIGFQLDNETKYYDTAGPDVQRAFTSYLRQRFNDDLDALNAALGLDYWSNRVGAWEDLPDVTGTVNGSLAAAFDAFRRGLVTEFLAWQRAIIEEYRRPDQLVTHNFDYEWRGHSFGIQPAVDHFQAARTVTVAGVDIYHPTQDHLTGREIAFGGDISRSLKDGAGYLVVETQAQGQVGWLPYPGQLRLQAYSHLASGALGVMYWHWGSIHSSFETYWKGLLSQDYSPNPTYREAVVLGRELAEHADSLTGLTKSNRVAVMVSNEALTALEWFSLDTGFPRALSGGGTAYNDVFRWVYDALFDLNVEVDIVPPTAGADRLAAYDVLVVPVLYGAPQSTTDALRAYALGGGHLVTTFRTGVADENLQVHSDRQPHGLSSLLGLGTDQLTVPEGVALRLCEALAQRLRARTGSGTGPGADGVGPGAGPQAEGVDLAARTVMELLTPVAEKAPVEAADPQRVARHGPGAADDPAIVGDQGAARGDRGGAAGGSRGQHGGAGVEVLASYDHHTWSGPAIARRCAGRGSVTHVATMTSPEVLQAVLRLTLEDTGLTDWAQDLAGTVSVRRGTNGRGRPLTYLLNYSRQAVTLRLPVDGDDVLGTTGLVGQRLTAGTMCIVPAWGVLLIES